MVIFLNRKLLENVSITTCMSSIELSQDIFQKTIPKRQSQKCILISLHLTPTLDLDALIINFDIFLNGRKNFSNGSSSNFIICITNLNAAIYGNRK